MKLGNKVQNDKDNKQLATILKLDLGERQKKLMDFPKELELSDKRDSVKKNKDYNSLHIEFNHNNNILNNHNHNRTHEFTNVNRINN